MASALRKLFKFSERHRSGEGVWHDKSNSSKKESTASPTHPHHSAAMHFSGHSQSPRTCKRETNKVCPEDGAHSNMLYYLNKESDCSPSDKSSISTSPHRLKSSKKAPKLPTHTANVRSRRLMKEFKEITKYSRNLEKPPFVVELVDDSLYEWNVKLFQIDPESEFYRDMQDADITHVLLNIVFPENFPFAPPFMRVISPHVEKGFVMEGGAICMELLTPRGWASAYTIEAVVMQFAASLVKGQGRIARKWKTGKTFNRKFAEASFRSLVKTHDKYGWVTPPLADG